MPSEMFNKIFEWHAVSNTATKIADTASIIKKYDENGNDVGGYLCEMQSLLNN